MRLKSISILIITLMLVSLVPTSLGNSGGNSLVVLDVGATMVVVQQPL